MYNRIGKSCPIFIRNFLYKCNMPQLIEKQKYEIIVRNELGQSSRQIANEMKWNEN